MPGPKSGVHGLICVDREGVASTKVVLQTRVVIRHWWLIQLFFLGAWEYRTSTSSRFSARSSSACGPVLPLLGFLRVRSACLVFCLRGARLLYFAVFDVVTYCGLFCGIFRVAGCPLGGEFCRM